MFDPGSQNSWLPRGIPGPIATARSQRQASLWPLRLLDAIDVRSCTMRGRIRVPLILSLLAFSSGCFSLPAFPAAGQQAGASRYPTTEEVFYVLSCMEMNGKTGESLQKCSCAINALEDRLPYDRYADAKLVLALRQAGGRNGAIYRDTAPMKNIVNDFVRAQQEANRICFGPIPNLREAEGK
jgi:hypothetical protein